MNGEYISSNGVLTTADTNILDRITHSEKIGGSNRYEYDSACRITYINGRRM
jgi:hypothetical protein